jgi:hypothetical protein
MTRVAEWRFGRLLLIWLSGVALAIVALTVAANRANDLTDRYRRESSGCGTPATNNKVDSILCAETERMKVARSRAVIVAWMAVLIGFLIVPAATGGLTIRWLRETRATSTDRCVRGWHPLKLAMLWAFVAVAVGTALTLFSESEERVFVVAAAVVFSFPLFAITWEWLSGREGPGK